MKILYQRVKLFGLYFITPYTQSKNRSNNNPPECESPMCIG